MGMSEKMLWIGLGILIGFVLGKIHDRLMTYYKEASNVSDEKQDGFFIRTRTGLREWRSNLTFNRVAVFVVVMLTAFASFQSQRVNNAQKANDKRDDARQAQIDQINRCTYSFLGKTIVALNERTTYSTKQADANLKLQKEQLRLLSFALSTPPPQPEDGEKAVQRYLKKLNTYVDLVTKTRNKQETNAYPTIEEFRDCVTSKPVTAKAKT